MALADKASQSIASILDNKMFRTFLLSEKPGIHLDKQLRLLQYTIFDVCDEAAINNNSLETTRSYATPRDIIETTIALMQPQFELKCV